MKRLLDVIAVLIFAPLIVSFCLAIAFLIRIKLGSPIFFFQKRAGLNGKEFVMVKFRSMAVCEGKGKCLPDEERITRFGRWLRSWSLDELPELWNVLKGDMSLIGPRPLLAGYVPLYDDAQKKRLTVRPGVTGWAQVNGRNAIGWEERFELDCWYVENQSLLLDLKILWMTVSTVLKREGIAPEGHVTMPPFTGNSTPEETP